MPAPLFLQHPASASQGRALTALASQLAIATLPDDHSLLPTDTLVLGYNSAGQLSLSRLLGREQPMFIDFVRGKAGYRRRWGGGKQQALAKAVGVNTGVQPVVVDATAGLGQDAFVLASLSCQVTLIERSPVIAALLADGLRRAAGEPTVANIISRMTLCRANALDSLQAMASCDNKPDVVYLDPLFPPRHGSAQVKKAMRLVQDLLGHDNDADALLAPALAAAAYRVVIKRPKHAPDLGGKPPSYRLMGRTCRYDVHALRRFQATCHSHS